MQEFYAIGGFIGRGHFGTVKKAKSRDSRDANEYAIKSILKTKIECRIDLLERELQVLMTVDHPNIVKFYEVFEDSRYIHIVMELCSGGELFEQLVSKGRYSEAQAAKIMYSVLHAVTHLHSLEIAHRDLKPENIMLSSPAEDSDIKIIDFGLAKKFLEGEEQKNTLIGSSYYVAPEVLKRDYGISCDVWSCGVILFMLLSGKPPFNGEDEISIFRSIMKSEFSIQGPEWELISPEAKEFICLLLNPDAQLRITAQQSLDHPWLSKRLEEDSMKVERKVLKRLRHHLHFNKIIKATMNFLIRSLKQSDIDELNLVFKKLDKDHTGFITLTELGQGLNEAGIDIEGDDLQGLLIKAHNYSGKINYSEFLAITMDLKHMEISDGLWLAFKFFDSENRGFITKENFFTSLKRNGWEITMKEVDEMIEECGFGKLDKLFFEQFCRVFQGK